MNVKRLLSASMAMSIGAGLLFSPTTLASAAWRRRVTAPQPSHKLLVDAQDTAALAQLRAGGGRLLVDYGTFSLWRVAGTPARSLMSRPGVLAYDDLDTILLRGSVIDTRQGMLREPQVAANLRQERAESAQFWLVQFVGPVRGEWVSALEAIGLAPAAYMPNNAYVVWGDGEALRKLDALMAAESFIQWNGPYHAAYRLAPALQAQAAAQSGAAQSDGTDVTVQFYRTAQGSGSLSKLLAFTGGVYQRRAEVLNFTNMTLRLPTEKLIEVAGWPDVFNVEPWVAPRKLDEAQGQIMAGNVISAGGKVAPGGPGYLAWLAFKGFPTTPSSYPVVDIVDDGIDQGDAANVLHADFHEFGLLANPDRVTYIQNCATAPAANGVAGHGNLNAGIVGAYNNLAGFPYTDSPGYRIGLGISPYGRIAGTKIFRDDGDYDVANCGYTDAGVVAASYNAGADMTSNSWGASYAFGAYDTSSQAYDALTRDASPTTPGNQEMLHIFAAGNGGPSAGTVSSPGTAKNVLTVGATESVRDDGVVDGLCHESNADNADDVAVFSSRGPTADQRVKPDIMAPGTHVQGPASQDGGFDGSGVCGGPGNDGDLPSADAYYPAGQALYTWSSGTSHAAPAIAGAASLLWEYYQRVLNPGREPSPAMLKALLLNTPRYLSGAGAGGNLPTNSQGWGDTDLGMAFDGLPCKLIDQSVVFTGTGQAYTLTGTVLDPSKPFHVSLVWTDAPGSTTGAAYVNDLNLEVSVGGAGGHNVYKGNRFDGMNSVTGGGYDTRNNVENVFLPAGASGSYTVRVIAANIAANAIPGSGFARAQDFALVIYNTLDDSGLITGRVTDAVTAQPIAGARIVASFGPTQTFSAHSGSNGAYALRVPQNGYTIAAAAYGYQPGSGPGLGVGAGTTTTVDFALTPATYHVISGVVSDDATGVPLSATVTIAGWPFNPPALSTATDPATGAYRFTVAGAQTYTLTASALFHSQGVRSVAVDGSDVIVGFALAATTPNGGVIGFVRDLYSDTPIADATVTMQAPGSLTGTTDARGYFQILDIPPGIYTLTASAELYSMAPMAGVEVLTSNLTKQDLLLSRSVLAYHPAALEKTIVFGTVVTDEAGLALSNMGAGSLALTLTERIEQPALSTTPAGSSRHTVLLVNDYAPDATQAFTMALSGLGYGLGYDFDVVAKTAFEAMSARQLLAYGALIYAGNTGTSAATASKAKLMEYLDAGGRLFIADDDVGYYNGNTAFYQTYLDATYGGDDPGSYNRNLTGENLMAGVNPSSSDPFPDFFTPKSYSTRIFHYADGSAGGSRVLRNSYRVIYVATDFNNLGTPSVGEAIEATVLQRSLDWLLGDIDLLPWLNASPLTVTLSASNDAGIRLGWNATPAAGVAQPGLYRGGLWLTSNDPQAPSVILPVTMTVLPSPEQGLLVGEISTSGDCDVRRAPLAGAQILIQSVEGFSNTLRSDGSGTYRIYLNQGAYTVTVSAVAHPTTTLRVVVSSGMTNTQDFELRLLRSCLQTNPHGLSVQGVMAGALVTRSLLITSSGALSLNVSVREASQLAVLGGPDAYGYRFIANSPYRFIDISKTGQSANPEDDGEFNIALSFPVTFHGVASTRLRVGNNGAILFNATAGDVSYANDLMVAAPDGFIAPLWDDFSEQTGAIYWQELGDAPNRMVVVQWHNRSHLSYGGGSPATFEVVLHESGNIEFLYQDVDFGDAGFDGGANATVGVRGFGAANRLQYSYHTASLRDQFGICFQSPAGPPCDDVPWLSVTPTRVVDLAGTPPASRMLQITFDPSAVSHPGIYTASVWLDNDSLVPGIQIPVAMTVPAVLYMPVIRRQR